MKLATVAHNGRTTAAVLDGDHWRSLPADNLSDLLATTALDRAADLVGVDLPGAVPVLPLPSPRKVVCCGLNYADHITEMGRELPAHPTLFAKYADSLTGPEDDLVLPKGLDVDWEAELAVVVGAELTGADRDSARAAIAGYTVANDISVRDWQKRTLQWFQGKAWDRTTPLGPVVVTPDALDPVAGVEVICRVDGTERQRGNTRTLVFDAADLLAYVSTFTTLRPGDVVLTGTPGGVGMGMTPPVFLADGDLVETEIPGIGTLRNRLRLTDSRS
ncbi:fumarylacetoacetate hydrolase family protein [Streptomyces sp. NPDC059837]|jgi:acylpyruvate hydrolase|uniref:fumarylacetoacetate hydrolase family protein n=1 Tax=unclassified Streptomyces TaxID=2593676 RepID=UPI0022524172|nr:MULTISPECIES: fumarylacetoacetate hydrolase family protein [unclassified Streptomyces]MCX4407665.1 fumarylacetoacetate hydrolase family protein [Streptomyces sp. NBC_01764]MCX5187616.1 fumarylacetoacetate hydrolase family protein [Streptomyces sp. NBC_00268]